MKCLDQNTNHHRWQDLDLEKKSINWVKCMPKHCFSRKHIIKYLENSQILKVQTKYISVLVVCISEQELYKTGSLSLNTTEPFLQQKSLESRTDQYRCGLDLLLFVC